MLQYAKECGLKRMYARIPGSWNWLSAMVLGKLAPGFKESIRKFMKTNQE